MDPRRHRLDRMIRRYAYDNRIPFGVAWSRFDERLRASRIHVDREIMRLRREGKIPLERKLSMPDAIELAGKLDSALQIADRMLGNQRRKVHHGH